MLPAKRIGNFEIHVDGDGFVAEGDWGAVRISGGHRALNSRDDVKIGTGTFIP